MMCMEVLELMVSQILAKDEPSGPLRPQFWGFSKSNNKCLVYELIWENDSLISSKKNAVDVS